MLADEFGKVIKLLTKAHNFGKAGLLFDKLCDLIFFQKFFKSSKCSPKFSNLNSFISFSIT